MKNESGWNASNGWTQSKLSIHSIAEKAGASLLYIADQASGRKFTKLLPRELPSGVKNGQYIQKVSDDYVIQDTDISYASTYGNRVGAYTIENPFPNAKIFVNPLDGLSDITGLTEIAWEATGDLIPNTYSTCNNQRYYFWFPLGTTLQQARASLTGKTLRYQLATPVDTLNVPFANPLIDLTKQNNNVALTGFAETEASGFKEIVCRTAIGDEISYTNLIADANCDGDGDFWRGDGASIVVSGGQIVNTANGTKSTPSTYQTQPNAPIIAGKRYFVKTRVRVTNSVCTAIRAYVGGASEVLRSNPAENNWYEIGTVIPASGAINNIHVYHYYIDSATANGKVMEMDWLMNINLTDNPQVQAIEAKLGRYLYPDELMELFPFTETSNTIKAQSVAFVNPDSINDIGYVSNAADVCPIGTENFAILSVIRTKATLPTGYMYAFSNTSGLALFSALMGSGYLSLHIDSIIRVTDYNFWTTNTLYRLDIRRIAGVLKVRINDDVVYSGPNTVSIPAVNFARLFARINSPDGTSHTGYDGTPLNTLGILKGEKCTHENVDKLAKELFKRF